MVEGDADPIIINGIIQRLISLDKVKVDVNSFAIIPTGQSRHTDALIRILVEANPKPSIGVLFDDDDGGRKRYENVKKILEVNHIPYAFLEKGSTTEDYVISPRGIFAKAVASYLTKIVGTKAEEIYAGVEKSFDKAFNGGTQNIKGLAKWSRGIGKELGLIDKEISPVGIAREYVLMLDGEEADKVKANELKRSVGLIKIITGIIELPEQTLAQEEIFQSAP